MRNIMKTIFIILSIMFSVQYMIGIENVMAEQDIEWNQSHLEQMDQLITKWSASLNQTYTRIYPSANTQIDSEQLSRFTNDLNFSGRNNNYGLAHEDSHVDFRIEYIYSTFGNSDRVITYYFVNYKGNPVIFVNDSDAGYASNILSYTENQELKKQFNEFVKQYQWESNEGIWTPEQLEELDKFMLSWKEHYNMDYHQIYPDTSVPHIEYSLGNIITLNKTLLNNKEYSVGFSDKGNLKYDITFVAAYSNYYEGIPFLRGHLQTLFFGYLRDATPVVLSLNSTNGPVRMAETEYQNVANKFNEISQRNVLLNRNQSSDGTQSDILTTKEQLLKDIETSPINTIKSQFKIRNKEFSEEEAKAYLAPILWNSPEEGVKHYYLFDRLNEGFYMGGMSTGGPSVRFNVFEVYNIIFALGKYGNFMLCNKGDNNVIYEGALERRDMDNLIMEFTEH